MNEFLDSPALRASGSILIILIAAWAALRVLDRALDRMRLYLGQRIHNAEDAQRIGTLGRVLRYTGTVAIIVIAIMLILHQLGISIAPILATAGLAAVANELRAHRPVQV